jgi:CAAX protease family protein
LNPQNCPLEKNLRNYLIISLILSVIIIISFILNYISGLGIPAKEYNLSMFFITLIPSLILSLFVLWPNYFGEEYGWRAYLQDRLFPLLGGYKGVLILGIIWGLWHTPLILIGLIYPGQPVLGMVLMILNTIVTGIIFSYAVLKIGSVWIAVILHMIVDTNLPVANFLIATSINPIFSFGTGIYGFALLAVFALILLKSKVWKTNEKVAIN